MAEVPVFTGTANGYPYYWAFCRLCPETAEGSPGWFTRKVYPTLKAADTAATNHFRKHVREGVS